MKHASTRHPSIDDSRPTASRAARALAVAAVCVSIAATPECPADVIFSNFNATTVWDSGIGYPANQPTAEYEQAIRYIADTTFLLDSLVLPVVTAGAGGFYLPNPPPGTVFGDSLQVGVYADAGGQPGTLLELINMPDSVPFWNLTSAVPAPIIANFAGTTMLSAGESYWFSIIETESTALLWMQSTSMAPTVRMARLVGNPTWGLSLQNRAGIQVHGTPVPGPSAALLLTGLMLTTRRRHPTR